MKNMKVSRKLMISFLIVAVLAAIVGVVGIIGMMNMDSASNSMYNEQTVPLPYLSNVTTLLQRLRVNMREYAIGVVENNMQQIDDAKTTIDQYIVDINANLNAYDLTITNAEARALFDDARNIFNNNYIPYLDSAYQYAKIGDLDGVLKVLSDAKEDTNKIVADYDRCMEIKVAASAEANDQITAQARVLLILIIVVLVAAVAIAVVLAFYISGLISKPASFMKDVLYKMGKQGVVNFTDEEYRQAEAYAYKDEIGDSIRMLIETGRRLETVGRALETVAAGDLTSDLNLLSNDDTMGLALQKMNTNLNNMFSEIKSSAAQVSTGSKQIADGAQSLAQGSTEQAAAVQQLSASIGEIAEKTKENAKIAREASGLSDNIKDSAEKGSGQMDQMMTAVKEINDASNEIEKVIKVIDDIAFQTNILALNAAVEAARAGSAGKGFAVVAEEVRNLAAKSADAAKTTGGLIENSVSKANLGLSIATETSESLKEIVEGINRSAEIITNIALSSDEQAGAIQQVNTGIDQVAQVVQQNSATAEESAAASEEMSGQSDMLDQLISQFKIKDSGGGYSSFSYDAPKKKINAPVSSPSSYIPSSGDYGKY